MTAWQPIETAPKSGRFLCWGGDMPRMEICKREAFVGELIVQAERGYGYKPTHWMPLPDAPEAK